MSVMPGRRVRCILFDLGSTLWHRADPATWTALETEANLRAGTTLRTRAPPVPSRVLFPADLPPPAEPPARGFLLGIFTNRDYGGEPFLADLRQMGLLDHIEPEHVAISGDVGYRKPHPAIFWHALNRLQVPLAEAAMVGDRLTADGYGAQQLGLFAVWRPWPRERAAAHDQELARGRSDPRQPVAFESRAVDGYPDSA